MPAASVYHWFASASEKLPRPRLGLGRNVSTTLLTLTDLFSGPGGAIGRSSVCLSVYGRFRLADSP